MFQQCLCTMFVLLYVDDILVYSQTFEQRMVHLAQVFQALTEAHLKVKIKKIVLQAHKIKFLGHQISANDIERNTKNIEAVLTFPTPKKVKVIQSFLGLCTYCRRYIKGFCKITEPLPSLLK